MPEAKSCDARTLQRPVRQLARILLGYCGQILIVGIGCAEIWRGSAGMSLQYEFDGDGLHEISQSALAAAVLILGLVILLELRSIARLRSLVDGHLTRVFEQLDLLRFDRSSRSRPGLHRVRRRIGDAHRIDSARPAVEPPVSHSAAGGLRRSRRWAGR